MTANQVTSAKEEALESLGRLLPSYAALQEQYSSHVHLPDYRAFSSEWEETLYRPIRASARLATDRRCALAAGALLYCAPGPHAPLLREDGETPLVSKFERVTLLDIDAAALESAKNTVKTLGADASVEEIALDFSGPFGQRLCNVYSEALSHEDGPAAVAQTLAEGSHVDSFIFFDEDQVLARLCAQLDIASGGRRYDQSVSEMVASFTGTAVWLAFRSALYRRFSSSADPEKFGICLQAATLLWQEYNARFLAFHLKFLQHQMLSGGSVLLAFDTRKVYDDPALAALSAFLPGMSITGMLKGHGFRVVRHEVLCWRDHPYGFDVSIYGIHVPDFHSHTHDVELYLLEVASQ